MHLTILKWSSSFKRVLQALILVILILSRTTVTAHDDCKPSSSAIQSECKSDSAVSGLMKQALFAARGSFHPVVLLPPSAVLLDLTKKKTATPNENEVEPIWSIGKYDEDRTIYDQPLFGGKRTIHVGIDLGGPAHTAVHAFEDGQVIHAGINPADGDYGPTIITEHAIQVNGTTASLYALHGHLSVQSLALSPIGRKFKKGDVIAWIGSKEVNGGWPPHLHFQLAIERPVTHDLPGAVATEDRKRALELYPDPRLVLGMIYED